MLWLEMRRSSLPGNNDWAFPNSLWSPSRNREGHPWSHWETLRRVRDGEQVLHLLGKGEDAAFLGISSADGDGFETTERPPNPGEWGFATSFYRVRLRDYTTLNTPVPVREVFKAKDAELRAYFAKNAARPESERRRLFYVPQRRTVGGVKAQFLQCFNGAYLSEVDTELAGILLGADPTTGTATAPVVADVRTNEQLSQAAIRVGQREFSDGVRANYGSRCCFPSCPVTDRRFLVEAHIVRWADDEKRRGALSNGLCFCLVHDRAFEAGLFTFDEIYGVLPHPDALVDPWLKESVGQFAGMPITTPVGKVLPELDALKEHWKRIRRSDWAVALA